MNIQVSRRELNLNLSLLQSVFGKKTTMPILNYILLSANGNNLTVTASNLDLTIQVKIPSDVKIEGSVALSGKLFTDICKEIQDDNINLILCDNDRVDVVSKSSNFKVLGVKSTSYPDIIGISINPDKHISPDMLLNMLSKVSYATSTDDTRFNIVGVNINFYKDKTKTTIRLVGTDVTRIALVTKSVDLGDNVGDDFNESIIVPNKSLPDIRRILEKEALNPVNFGIKDGFLVLQGNTSKIVIRLIDADYPDYRAAIPSPSKYILRINSLVLNHSLRRVGTVSESVKKTVKFEVSGNKLILSASSPDLGEAIEELEVDYNGDDLTINVNSIFLREALSTLNNEETVNIEFNGGNKPIRIYGSDDDCLHILMPISKKS